MKEIVEIKKLNQHNLFELKQLIAVLNNAFENKTNSMADDNYLYQLLYKNHFHVFVALRNDRVVGGVTAIEIPSVYKNENELFIYDIGVDTIYQRKGIGSKLIDALKNFCKPNNIKTIFVAADADDEHAVNFYKQTNALSKKVIHFEYHSTHNQ